jgi:hypothetical protein|tara:strand:- start:257 stop:415 length:159 start_codon:yes stop_codon:yes gene_type:complete
VLLCDERSRCGTGISLMRDVSSLDRFLPAMACRADASQRFRFVFAARATPCA